MADARSRAALRQVHRLFGEGTVVGLTEGQLLERFVARRDEAAFEALVARHGPMVLAACRRVLRDPHDAEDAFQATFLVLARKAGSIRQANRLGPWLYKVARRAAERARIVAARRRACERRAASAEAGPPEPDDRGDLRPLLYEEVDRLPKSYRAAIVLCYLQGQTHEEAARRLAWPVGTVRGRLARARALLRERLTRRGVAPSAALAIDATLEGASESAVPPALSAAAIGAATRSAGGLSTGNAATPAAALAKGVLKAMFLTKLKLIAATGIVGVGLLAPWAAGSDPQETGAAVASAKAGPQAKSAPPAEAARSDTDRPIPPEEEFRRHRLMMTLEDIERAGVPFPDPLTIEYPSTEAFREREERRIRRFETAKLVDRLPDEDGDAGPERDIGELMERAERLRKQIHEGQSQLKATEGELQRLRSARVAIRGRAEGPVPAGRVPREFERTSMPEYVVEPPDMIEIRVLQALPGRPIAGERLVRPDGTVTLGYYGNLYVAGLTLTEIKEKVILHLRKYLDDEALGLIEPKREGDRVERRAVDPKDSAKVSIDVVAYNSKVYYVEGDVKSTGRFPITGNDTVLDAISYAGGLGPTADPGHIRLIRPSPPGTKTEPRVLPVDYDAITRAGDPTTNYQLMPGDRLCIDRRPEAMPKPKEGREATEERLTKLEQKVDLILQELRSQRREPKPE